MCHKSRFILGAALLAAGLCQQVVAPPGAQAAGIAKVQSGPLVTSTTTSLVLTLPAASTAGDLLVASIAASTPTPSFTGPTGWARASSRAGTGDAEIWYLASSASGITSATFSAASGTVSGGTLLELSGVAASGPLDQTGTVATGSGASSASVTTSGATAVGGELAITSFEEALTTSQTVTFTPGTGWANVASSASTAYTAHITSDDELGLAVGTATERETSSVAGTWAEVIATFRPVACSGGALTMTTPAMVTFPGTTLTGRDQTATTTAVVVPNDQTGSGAGWKVSGTSTVFVNAAGKTLAATATTVTGASASSATGNCSLPTNAVTYPVTLPAGPGPPAAVKLFDAVAGTGAGPSSVAISFKLAVPANTFIGTYTSTWTMTVSSGP